MERPSKWVNGIARTSQHIYKDTDTHTYTNIPSDIFENQSIHKHHSHRAAAAAAVNINISAKNHASFPSKRRDVSNLVADGYKTYTNMRILIDICTQDARCSFVHLFIHTFVCLVPHLVLALFHAILSPYDVCILQMCLYSASPLLRDTGANIYMYRI